MSPNTEYPLVSVAIVTYNQSELLRETIESVLVQDYPNIQIIIADDASPDDTAEMVDEYALRYPDQFVLCMAKTNVGVTQNQNMALAACTGKYIAWMAGDDLMLPGKITKQVSFLENNPDHAIVYHNLDVFDSDSGRTLYLFNDIDKPRTGGVETLVKYGAFNGAVSNMVRRSMSPVHGFDRRIAVASDWLYFVDCLIDGGLIGYIPEVLGRYRRHAANITSGSIRAPSLAQTQDHLFSCESILSRSPQLRRAVDIRRAFLLRSLRWHDGGSKFNAYLRASLSSAFHWKTLILLLLSYIGKRR